MTDLTIVDDDGTVTRTDLPRLPESLLAPLLDSAGDLIRTLQPGDVPLALRPLAGFDRRGLARGAARQQLLKAIDQDSGFFRQVSDRFLERSEVLAVLESWLPGQALPLVDEAAERADLPLLASALYARRPDGWAFGLGAVCAAHDRTRREKEADDDTKALQTQLATLDEARRRGLAALAEAQTDATRLEQELREERRSRRAREEQAARAADSARAKAADLEGAVAKARAATDAAEGRAEREARRARELESELQDLRGRLASTERALAEKADALEHAAAPGTGLRYADLQALADAAELARRLAAGLGGVVDQARKVTAPPPSSGASSSSSPRAKRVEVAVPPGMVVDSPEAFDAMSRATGVVLVVDGYNVSMRAWSGESATNQRERLLAALVALHARTHCDVTVVFDGADVGTARPSRNPGVRTLFSAADEEADAVVVREVAALPPSVPAIVVSSDKWVRDHAAAAGARVVSSDTLLRALRA